MNLERFTFIVESYGSEPERWPQEERDAALAFASSSDKAAGLLEAETELDVFLARFELPESPLPTISLQRPAIIERWLQWLLPDFNNLAQTLWRPTLAGVLPFFLGIGISFALSLDTDYQLTTEEEIYLAAMTDTISEERFYE
ncbi:MAG: hypothetical protein HOC70_03820 [Gammaproteobacteria bacterium]|jgi:hypothetical protein|nr:hypothetical protein [Gammaproteobacteria bacterium]MBT4492347.1 hypothetical protein [Gammaproteobacteria bacterium]MBT7371984.1 hypothetical protein [Gammaproteobacteria bacterium]